MFHAVRKGWVSAQSMTDEQPHKDVEKTTEVPAASAVAANNDDGDAVGKSVAGDGGDGRHDWIYVVDSSGSVDFGDDRWELVEVGLALALIAVVDGG